MQSLILLMIFVTVSFITFLLFKSLNSWGSINFILEIALYHYETDPAIKESNKERLHKEILPYYLPRLDGIAKANNGHLAVGKVGIIFFPERYIFSAFC